jgi:hypothetical protein
MQWLLFILDACSKCLDSFSHVVLLGEHVVYVGFHAPCHGYWLGLAPSSRVASLYSNFLLWQ